MTRTKEHPPTRPMMSSTLNRRHWMMAILVVMLALPLRAQTTAGKFRPSGDGAAAAGHYEVVLASSEAGDDLSTIAEELARAYGGRLEPFAEQGVRAFAIVLSPVRARMLSADPRVSMVIERGGMPSHEPVPAVASLPSPAAPSVGSKPLLPAVNGTGSWSSGTFAYDGAGNVKAIGTNVYVYDTVSRLVSGTVEGPANRQDYSYDSFGNRTATARTGGGCVGGTDCEEAVTINSLTNRIKSNSAKYDEAGNLTSFDSTYSYTYDGAGMLVRETATGVDQQYLYTADDERIATIQGTAWTWTVRDLGGKVQRTFTSSNGSSTYGDTGFQWAEDYVWRDGLLLASESPSGTRHYHLDHLGTPRLVTNDAGVKIGLHSYYPFGAELAMTQSESPTELMKFTGHQRDLLAGDLHTLDYMHARYYNPNVGKFMSVDPAEIRSLGHPQTWNRYGYASNNSVVRIDPDGLRDIYVAIWLAKSPFIFGSGSVGHAAAFELSGKVILSQFPLPHGHKGKNLTSPSYQDTLAREDKRLPSKVYKVFVPNDILFDASVTHERSLKFWDWMPTTPNQTNCVFGLSLALYNGGVPVSVDNVPGGLADDLDNLMKRPQNHHGWSVDSAPLDVLGSPSGAGEHIGLNMAADFNGVAWLDGVQISIAGPH
jgi:RHS repeat-associated protein